MQIEPLIESSKIILLTGLIIFISHFFTALFEKTRIPDVLLLIILGVIIQISLLMFNIEDYYYLFIYIPNIFFIQV